MIWSSLICTYIGFFLFGLVCIALGIFISSLTEMPLLAILMSELAMLLLMLMDNLSVNSFLSSHSGAVRCAELVLQSDEVLCILPGTDAILRSAGLFH